MAYARGRTYDADSHVMELPDFLSQYVWARLAESRIPFALHVGGNPLQIDPAWMNTARTVPTDWLGAERMSEVRT